MADVVRPCGGCGEPTRRTCFACESDLGVTAYVCSVYCQHEHGCLPDDGSSPDREDEILSELVQARRQERVLSVALLVMLLMGLVGFVLVAFLSTRR